VPGERVEQLDVLLGPVHPLPVVLPDSGHVEQPAGLDPGPVVFELPRPRADRVRRHSLADLVVDVLDLLEERIAAIGEHVLLRPQRQVPAGPQRLPGPPVPDTGVHPVPGRGREHQADRFVRPPILEPSLHHLDVEPSQVPAGHRGELAAQLQARETEPPPGQRQRGLSRGAPHLQQPVTRRQPGQCDQVVEERLGIIRPDPVVDLGRLVKRRPQPLSLRIGPHPGQYRKRKASPGARLAVCGFP
jgi:hypothetical protein